MYYTVSYFYCMISYFTIRFIFLLHDFISTVRVISLVWCGLVWFGLVWFGLVWWLEMMYVRTFGLVWLKCSKNMNLIFTARFHFHCTVHFFTTCKILWFGLIEVLYIHWYAWVLNVLWCGWGLVEILYIHLQSHHFSFVYIFKHITSLLYTFSIISLLFYIHLQSHHFSVFVI